MRLGRSWMNLSGWPWDLWEVSWSSWHRFAILQLGTCLKGRMSTINGSQALFDQGRVIVISRFFLRLASMLLPDDNSVALPNHRSFVPIESSFMPLVLDLVRVRLAWCSFSSLRRMNLKMQTDQILDSRWRSMVKLMRNLCKFYLSRMAVAR